MDNKKKELIVMMNNKDYIEREYRQAISDFKISHNEDDRWDCRKRMAKLELLACEFYGYQYLDYLEEMKKELLA